MSNEPSSLPGRRLPFERDRSAAILATAEALLEGVARSGRNAVRWYLPTDRALLLGASQRLSTLDSAACRSAGVGVYRRAAGGNVVLSDENMLGVDIVVTPDSALWSGDVTESYRWLGASFRDALATMGVPAHLVSIGEARASTAVDAADAALAKLTCFGGLSPYEVTVGERKIVGLAQVRRRHGALFQCAVPLHWRPLDLARLIALPDDERLALATALEARATGLYDLVGVGSASHEDGSTKYLGEVERGAGISGPVAGAPIEENDVSGDVASTKTIAAFIGALESAFAARGLLLQDDAWTPSERDRAAHALAERYVPLDLPLVLASRTIDHLQ